MICFSKNASPPCHNASAYHEPATHRYNSPPLNGRIRPTNLRSLLTSRKTPTAKPGSTPPTGPLVRVAKPAKPKKPRTCGQPNRLPR